MERFTVRLERVFHGPMDLLLHLVREQEVEIQDVEISSVVEEYMEYLEHLKDLDIEVAGEFLVMAATLLSIKSRSLLPREEVDLTDELDPRDDADIADGHRHRLQEQQNRPQRNGRPDQPARLESAGIRRNLANQQGLPKKRFHRRKEAVQK